ncbi:MAG: response regulator, partial [Anaerolineales bacterium]|nr:response regulator [Anaerolineales bacterium]
WAKNGHYTLMTVSDTGCGIDKIIQSKIFDPFFTTKEVGRGTGLGLATAYGIVNQHNGMIYVDSEPERGTTFGVYLPLVDSGDDEEIIPSVPESAGGKETVLLAEDDSGVQKLAKKILENAGYRVITATDGEEAIELIKEKSNQIDIAIIDAVMPKKSGKEVMGFYNRMNPEGRVLLVSGYSVGVMDVSNMDGDAVAFISKPFGSSIFLRSVRQLLDG